MPKPDRGKGVFMWRGIRSAVMLGLHLRGDVAVMLGISNVTNVHAQDWI